MNKKLKAVAFDLDGLMFDTEDVYWKAADILLKRREYAYTQELCDAIMGRPPQACFELFKEHFNLSESWRELQKESEDIFLEVLNDGFSPMPGLFELLDWLEENDIPKGICTSSAERLVREVLGRHNLIERFLFLITAEGITKGKPDPEIYQKAADLFGIDPSEMMVLEDSIAGSKAAIAAGANAVAIRAEHNKNFDFSFVPTVLNSLASPEIREMIAH